MGLNRHRRGYAIKESASGVHSQDVGSYWARPVSIFKLPSSLSSPLFSSHNRYHYFKSYITTGTIALSKAVVPINTSSSGISRNLDKTSHTHAARYQTTPINLMHNIVVIVRLNLM